MKKYIFLISTFLLNISTYAQTTHKEAVLETVMKILSKYKDSSSLEPKVKWSYDLGVVLEGVAAMWESSANGTYFKYIQNTIDPYLDTNNHIKTYKESDYSIDNIKNGRALLLLYKTTLQKKYLQAATELWKQLQQQPRTKSRGFWHKKIYPNQIWLDGLYMAQPFYTEYAALVGKDSVFDDVADQFIAIAQKATDRRTGLIYHGWDETHSEKWASPQTGLSPQFWARAIGWYMMALVDVLDYFPKEHPKRQKLIEILNSNAAAIATFQSKKNALWYDIVDKETTKGNYPEASASSMFVYALAKGVHKKYLPAKYLKIANNAFMSIEKTFIEIKNGQTNLNGTVSVSGLGGKGKYRDGSFTYYMSEKVVANDLKGIGAYLLAANEITKPNMINSKNKNVVLDNYFNNEWFKSAFGNLQPFHYLWEEKDNNGFSFWGNVWMDNGYQLSTLKKAPTVEALKKTSIYIIVDPDNQKETMAPNYMTEEYVKTIAKWVKDGGKLILMTNDSGNCELKHFNLLASKFGFTFNLDKKNTVEGHHFEQGGITISPSSKIFKKAKEIYLKEISTIKISNKKQVNPVLIKNDDVIMVSAQYGRGTVFAVGDPWLYNEYVDGRKLPAEYENFLAAKDLVQWISKQ